MKHENNYVRHYHTDADRENVLKLLGCGLSVPDIADITHISKTSIAYIRQAHTACMNKDWDTVKRLVRAIKPTAVWALKVTGTEDEYLEYLYGKVTTADADKVVENMEVTLPVETDTSEDIKNLLVDIRSLLTDIRDMWR